MGTLFRFPNPVNEVSARLVAGGVVVLALVILVGHQPWLLAPLAYGFVARVLTGPTLSPLGQVVTRVVTPRLPVAPRLVPGPPKRFAQGIGAAVTVSAAVLHFAFGLTGAAYALVGAACRGRRDGVDPGLLHRLPGLRAAHALGRDPGRGVRELQQPGLRTDILTPGQRGVCMGA